jgi:hypothetical protein
MQESGITYSLEYKEDYWGRWIMMTVYWVVGTKVQSLIAKCLQEPRSF